MCIYWWHTQKNSNAELSLGGTKLLLRVIRGIMEQDRGVS